jgi:NADPH:quinone reductase
MRAAQVHAWASDPAVVDVPEPRPAEGETLVRVAAAAIAHIDLTVAGGDFFMRPQLPYVPGTEGAGTVAESGRFATGAAVRIRGAGVGLNRDGTCAQLAAVPDAAVHELPPGTDLEVAAGFFSPCVTAHAALHAVGGLSAGERVAVTGASGAVGSMTLQLAARAGAGAIVAVTRDAARLRAVPPGTVVATDGAAGVVAAVPDGIDLLVDTVGGALLPELATRCVRPGGRAVLVGYAAGEATTLPLPALLGADVRLLPMNLIRRGAALGPVAEELLAALSDGELTLARTVLPLERIAEALAHVRAGTAVGRVILTPP